MFPPNGQTKLPTMPPEPVYDESLGEKKHTYTKRTIDARGYEPIHTEVIVIFLFLQLDHGAARGKKGEFPYLETEKIKDLGLSHPRKFF